MRYHPQVDDSGLLYPVTAFPIFPARAVHLHREVATTFYRAVAPRLVPLSKRLFWRVVLAMAASPLGKRLLLALRR